MDLDALLKHHGDDAPSGPDLEYDGDFMEMEVAGRPPETRSVGNVTVEGEDTDYKDLYARAIGVLGRAHDLRAAVYAADAGVRLHGLEGWADATSLIRGMLESWPR